MEFCSKYGYNYGFEGSDEETFSDHETEKSESVQRRIRKADSNIIAVKFDELVLTNQMFAGEPIKCKKCDAIMSNLSRQSINLEKKIWKCEFCFEENDISKIESLEQIPNVDDVTFLLEPEPKKVSELISTEKADLSDKVKSTDNNYLMYCIDISGSMDTNIPIKPVDNSNKNSLITRLQAVKVACAENLSNLKDQEPNKRVSLVTFSDRIKFYGDGSKREPIFNTDNSPSYQTNYSRPNRGLISSMRSKINSLNIGASNTKTANNHPEESQVPKDLLENKEKMIAWAHNQDGNIKPVSESYKNLEFLIKNLQTEGSTALGPGLVFSIGYCSKQAGSQIILCTDGCANIGMGTVNGENADKFYEDLAEYAKEQGVTVNVISMEGTDCKLALLGKVADRTNGTMSIVNPLNLNDQFKSILENRIVATEVKAKLIVNSKYLYIRSEELEEAEAKFYSSKNFEDKTGLDKFKTSVLVKDIGNANIDTEITFEYGIRKLSEQARVEESTLKELPFQLQISYTLPSGAKAMRVYTKIQEFTNDRKKAENSLLSQDLIYSNFAQKMSNHVSKSNVSAAKYRSYQVSNMLSANNWTSPKLFSENLQMVSDMSESCQAQDMNDIQANMVFQGKKMNRKYFKK